MCKHKYKQNIKKKTFKFLFALISVTSVFFLKNTLYRFIPFMRTPTLHMVIGRTFTHPYKPTVSLQHV